VTPFSIDRDGRVAAVSRNGAPGTVLLAGSG